MDKKKEKADLEQMLAKLLNDLLRMGWKPFNRDKTLHINCYDKCKGLNYKWIHLDGGFMNEESRTLRELVSIDSGLWQFVCGNGMIDNPREDFRWTNDFQLDYIEFNQTDFQYWVLESALCDEDKLEDFILDNVKIDE